MGFRECVCVCVWGGDGRGMRGGVGEGEGRGERWGLTLFASFDGGYAILELEDVPAYRGRCLPRVQCMFVKFSCSSFLLGGLILSPGSFPLVESRIDCFTHDRMRSDVP